MIQGSRTPAGFFSGGEQLSARALNEMGAVASKGMIVHNDGASALQGTFGTVFANRQTFAQTDILDFPFKVTLQGTQFGIEAVVRPGTVNNRIPKIATKYLDDPEPPTLKITEAGIYDVVIQANKTGVRFFPDSVYVDLYKRDTYADTDDKGYLVVASFTITGTAPSFAVNSFSQSVYSSQVVVRAKPGSAPAVWAWTSR